MADEEILHGGVNQIRRVGNTVIRPAGQHTPSVHRLLHHLRNQGFTSAPRPLGHDRDAGTETLTFVQGEVTGAPLAATFETDQALVSAAALLRDYHEATVGFAADLAADPAATGDVWDLQTKSPVEVICHGDYAPYNCAIRNGSVVGIFDFDTAHPGPRLWDLGYAAYRWVPLASPTNPDASFDAKEQSRRLLLFCKTYGWHGPPTAVTEAAADRLVALVDMMLERAEQGNAAFRRHIEEGHDQLYLADIAYLRSYGD